MAVIIGGPETGLLDSSFGKLGRDDATSKSEVGHGEEILVNVSSGNLTLRKEDTYLPSLGDDYQLVRTYNSRGRPSDASQHDDARWTSTTSIHLNKATDRGEKYFEVEYGDGSFFDYRLDKDSGLYVSTDGAGAYETLEALNAKSKDLVHFIVTRADQTKLSFDKQGNLVLWEDPNGVGMTYTYKSNRLVKVEDDDGHIINYNFSKGRLVSVTDEKEGVLVEYRYSKGRLSEVVDREGSITKYFYTNDGFVNRIVLPADNGDKTRELKFEYQKLNVKFPDGGSGQSVVMTKLTDAEGKVTLFDYDFTLGSGQSFQGGKTTVTDAAGQTLIYTYDVNGYITKVVDQDKKVTSYKYDADGNVLEITDRRGNTSVFTYDDRGNLESSKDNSGNLTEYTYTDFNKIARIETPEGGVTTFEYDAGVLDTDGKETFNLLRQTDPGGDVTEFDYDQYGNLTKSIVYLSSYPDTSEKQVTQYFYDAYGNNIQTIDPEGNVVRNNYDHFGNLLQTIAYDKASAPRSLQETANNSGLYKPEIAVVNDQVDQVSRYTYDEDNRLLTATDPEGHTTTYTYDAVGNVTAFQDARGSVTTYIYDRNNRLIGTIEPASANAEKRETTRTYDFVGNETSFKDAEGRTVTYTYSARRELLTVTTEAVAGAPNGYTTSYKYDAEGNQISVVDNRGNESTFTYTPTNLIKTETNNVGHTTQYSYDMNLNVLSIVAGMQLPPEKRQVVRFDYDEEDQVIKVREKTSDGGDDTSSGDEFSETEYSYDAPGTIASIKDGNGNVTDFEYDGNNRLVREILPAVPGEDGDPDDVNKANWVRYEVLHRFDAFGNEVETVDGNDNTVTYAFDRDNRATQVIEANGVTTTYQYDENDNITSITIDGPNTDVAQVTTYVYDKFNQLIAEVDGVGNALANSNAPLYQTIREEMGRPAELSALQLADKQYLRDLYTTRYTYDKVGNNLTARDNAGSTTDFKYDNLDRLVLRTDAEGGTREYRYDGNNNVVELKELVVDAGNEVDKQYRTTIYEYDEHNRLISTENPLNELTELDYDAFDNITQVRAAVGSGAQRTSSFEYDLRNLLLNEYDSANPNDRKISYEYDAVGNRTRVTDARGNAAAASYNTEYVYDALNRNIEIKDRRNLVTQYVYDGVGNQMKVIDPRGGVTEFKYDLGNRLIGFVDAEQRETSYQYDALGNQIVQTTAVGTGDADGTSRKEEVTTFKYDAENNLREVIDANGESTTFGFDRVYNQTLIVDSNLNETKTTFDALNRVLTIENADGDTREVTYDAVGNILTEKDELNRVTTYSYDKKDQLLSVIGPDNVETTYQSDAFGSFVAITRAAGTDLESTRHFEYNKFGKLIKEYDPTSDAYGVFDPATTTTKFVGYTYDKNDNITSKTDQNGNTTQYEYNENDQLTLIKDPATTDPLQASVQSARATTRFDYDGSGNRNYVEDANGNITRTYYNANNEVALVVDALGYATGTLYDANGNVASTTRYGNLVVTPGIAPAPSSSDRTTLFEYDALNQLTRRTDPEGFSLEYVYDAVGNVKVVRQQTAMSPEAFNTTRYKYDDLNRLIEAKDDYNKVETYGYDEVGNKTSEADKNGNTTFFTYDVNDRLLTIDRPLPVADAAPGAEPEDRLQVFTYDDVGNLRSEKDENNVFTYYEYNERDLLLKTINNRGDFISFEYDDVGKQTAVTDERLTRTEYKYDELNRLVKVKQAAGSDEEYVESYRYDLFGNEAERIEDNRDFDGNLVRATTVFSYDELNRLESRADAENGVTDKLVITYDAFGNQLSKMDESGVLTEFTYDLNDRLITIVEADSDDAGSSKETTTIGYDGAGNEISRTDQRGATTVYEYDKLNRLVFERQPEGGETRTTYDAVGNVVAFEDQRTNSFYVEYDENNRRTAVLTKEGFLTTFRYDNVGNVTTVSQYNEKYSVLIASDGSINIPAPRGSDNAPRVTANTYNDLNQLATTTEPRGLMTSYVYDAAGNIVEIMETAPAPAAALVAAAEGAPEGAAPAPKTRERVSYNKKNQIISREDANGVVTKLVLDNKGNVLRRTEAFGTGDARTTTYKYDKLDRLIEEKLPKTAAQSSATTITYEYDASDRPTKRTTSGDTFVGARVETFGYNKSGLLAFEETAITSKNGAAPLTKRTGYEYDAAGNVSLVTYAQGTGDVYTNQFIYDDNNRLIAEIDGEGVRTEYEYDDRGNKVETRQGRNAAGTGWVDQVRITEYEYDAQDRLTSITNPEDGETRYYYDAKGNQNIILDANGTVTVNTFDLDGRILTNIVGRGTVTEASGPNGFATASISSDFGGIKTENTYDARGNVTSTTVGYANGTDQRITTYEYDDLDQLEKIVDPEGFSTTFIYDVFGNQTSVTVGAYESVPDEPGFDQAKADRASPQTTTFEYDAADRIIKTIDGKGNSAANAYDAHGNQISLTTGIAEGPNADVEHLSVTTYRYDEDGKLVRKETDEGGIVEITRNALGQQTVLRTLQSAGVWLTERSEYDSYGRVTAEVDATPQAVRTEYDYDAVGNLVTLTRDAGRIGQRVTQYQYDANSNLTRQINPVDTAGQQFSYIAYTYDALGNRLTTQDVNGTSRAYYDEYSQQIASVDAANFLTTFKRDVAGNILTTRIYARALPSAGIALPTPPTNLPGLDNRVLYQTFDKNGYRTSATSANGAKKIYEFNSVGLLTQQTEQAATDVALRLVTTDLADKVLTWTYDAVGRLETFVNVDGVTESYAYDAAGNKITESTSNPNALDNDEPEQPRTVTYTYDDNNRLETQTDGSTFERVLYDLAGNVIGKKNAAGDGTTTTYDQSNRIATVTDAENNTFQYSYDRVGNLVAVEDPKGFISTLEYDLNDRVILEKGPLTDFYTIPTGNLISGQSQVMSFYDGAGNLVRRTGESGYNLTRWYDSRNQMIAEVDPDSVLRTYSYNAFGEVEATYTKKTRVDNSPSLNSSAPTLSAGPDTVGSRNEFDDMGNIIRTVLPSIDTTTVAGTTATLNVNQLIEATTEYDAWGNAVGSTDPMGNPSYSFVDARGRQVALVDAEGYLIETSYDSLGNVVRQAKYANTVSIATDGDGRRLQPSAPNGYAFEVIKLYDAYGRLVREESAEVQLWDYSGTTGAKSEPVTTTFTYDAADNVTSKTLASGTNQAQTEYYYFNKVNQRTHVVTSAGVLATFDYDDNGNLQTQKRYLNRVAVPTAGARPASPPSAPAGSSGDQVKRYEYNEVNLLSRETTEISDGNIVTEYEYDASRNLTRKIEDATDERLVSQFGYDTAGRINLTISPNGSQTSVEFNYSGLKTRVTTGGDPDAQAPAINEGSVNTSLANGTNPSLAVEWDLPAGTGLTSWVAWDTSSRAGASSADLTSSLPNGSSTPGTGYSFGSGASSDGSSASISLNEITAGQQIFFRVMVRDSLGNVSWSQERSVAVPTYVEQAFVRQSGPTTYVVEAEFNGTVTAPKLVGGPGSTEFAMTALSGNRWSVELTGISDPSSYQVGFTWDAGAYDTDRTELLSGVSDPRDGDDGASENGTLLTQWILWNLPSQDTSLIGNTQLVVVEGVPVADGTTFRSLGGTLQQELAVTASASNYDLYYGNRVATANALTVDFEDTENRTIIELSETSSTTDDVTTYTTTWKEQYVNEVPGTITTSVAVDLDAAEAGTVAIGTMQLAYRKVPAGNFDDSVAFTTLVLDPDVGGVGANVFTSAAFELDAGSSYDLKVFYVDTSGKEVIVQLQRVDVPAENIAGDPSPLRTLTSTASQPAVVPEWAAERSVPIASADFSDNSLTVLAKELDGRITRDGSADRQFEAGDYSGPVDTSAFTSDAPFNTTGGTAGKSASFADLPFGSRPYYTEYRYNDLGMVTASNEEGGLWREFGVDANGNEVHTRLLGDKYSLVNGVLVRTPGSPPAPAPIETYAAFDKRGLETETRGPNTLAGRAITLTTYDYASRIASIDDPGPGQVRTFTYDGAGNLIGETDALGGAMAYYYDRLGNLVRKVDQKGDVEVYRYTYTQQATAATRSTVDQLTSTYFEGLQSSTTVTYTYDSFGRRIAMTKGSGGTAETTQVTYDQKSRVKTVTDGENNVTTFWYDNRDNQVLVQDANGRFFGRAYNEMGLLTHEFGFDYELGSLLYPTAQAALNLMASSVAGSTVSGLVVTKTEYNIFNNKSRTVSAGGKAIIYTYKPFGRLESAGDDYYRYDEFGRQILEYVEDGNTSDGEETKRIIRNYDDAGRLIEVDDVGSESGGTRVRTLYTYDVAGNRKTEVLTRDGVTERSQTYGYNHKNELTSWRDSAVTGAYQNYTYHADGNLASVGNVKGTTSYVFDAADRITTVNGAQRFTYNSAGRRATEAGVATYAYLSNGWLSTATTTSGTVYTWNYDDVGNVSSIFEGGTIKKNNTEWDYAYRVTKSGLLTDQVSSTTFSRDGKVTRTSVINDGKTFTYNYFYDDEGREVLVSGGGGGDGAAGTSSSVYDRNGRLVTANLGVGDIPEDGPTPVSVKNFRYDNDGKIVWAYKNGSVPDESGTFKYLYANGDPAGEYQGTRVDNTTTTKLNEGNYATLKGISAGLEDQPSAFPASGIIQHTVQAGETLRTIADQYYGSPDLWYVIADANGLTGKEMLQVGSRLVVPNTAENAYHTAETNPLYKEGDIVGSNLPNLKTPPPEEDECKKITAIILIVVVAIAAIALTVVTVGAAAPAAVLLVAGSSAGLLATIAVSVVVGAVIGAAIAFAASAITQGILIGFELQEEFDWDAVAADVVAGAFGGAAAGLGYAVSTAKVVSLGLKVGNIAGQLAFEAGGEAISQYVQNGAVTNPWLVVAAGAGGALGAVGDLGKRSVQLAKQADGVGATARQIGSVEDVASVAKQAGKGRLGQAKDVFVSQFKQQIGGTFKQSLGKTADQKFFRTVTTRGGDFATVSFTSAARESVKGTSKTARLVKAGKVAGGIAAAPLALAAAPFVLVAQKLGSKTAGNIVETATTAIGAGVSSASTTAKAALNSARKTASAAITSVRKTVSSGVEAVSAAIADLKLVETATSAVKTGAKVVGGALAAPVAVLAAPFVGVAALLGNKTARGFVSTAKVAALGALDAALDGAKASFKSAKESFGAVLDSAKESLSTAKQTAREAIEKAKNFEYLAALKKSAPFNPRSAEGASFYGGYGTDVLGFVEDGIPGLVPGLRTDKEGKSIYSGNVLLRKGGLESGAVTFFNKVTTFSKPLAGAVGGYLATSVQRGEVYIPTETEIVSNAETGGKIDAGASGARTYIDNNARSTFADLHSQQHNYVALEWRAVAGNTTTQILSPFAIDRAASVDKLVTSNKMVAGEVWDFDQESFVTFAEGSVGGVGGDASRTPGSFG